ncbi:hypothetical protein BJ878DRAFT_397805, partial [Calycina marina]
MVLDRPIPAFYCCYLLRSTVRTGSVYVGSTPNPVRRLKQHNGLTKGGAVRTSRNGCRPWEMACIVSGFPSHIATLQFEWAWQNPHITLRIPPESRIQHAAGRRKSGQPKRPRHTVSSLLSNLHLLLRVPSFLRWPLSVRFFNPDVHESWLKMCKTAREPIRSSVPIVTDFPPDAIPDSEDEGTEIEGPKKRQKVSHGIGALGVEYEEFREHVVKAKEIFEFEREGRCAVCEEDLEHDAGIYTICPSPGCQSVTHLTCLSKHFLEDDKNTLIPTEGSCPSCNLELKWISVVKELSLRMRGQKEVEKLLRVKRARKGKATSPQAVVGSDNELSDEEVEEEE